MEASDKMSAVKTALYAPASSWGPCYNITRNMSAVIEHQGWDKQAGTGVHYS